MKKDRMACRLLLVTIILLMICQITSASEFNTMPRTNGGKRWCLGYYEGGQYSNYYKYLTATIQGLMDIGWIEKKALPHFPDNNTQKVWNWLATSTKSKYLTFRDDAFYSAKWDPDTREKISKTIIDRLTKKTDIDVMIAMGTWAGKDLANDRHNTDTIIMSTSDPIGSSIIKSVEDSGRDHIHARVDPDRYKRQVEIFHDLVKFKNLGIAYEDTIAGRSYAAVDWVEKVANERGFEIRRCFTDSDIANLEIASESVQQCFSQLIKQGVDAIYVTVQGGVNNSSLPKLVSIANDNRIPTFSQFGSKEVKKGLLMSISRAGGFKPAGRFFAATLAQVFNGAKPRQLNQVFEEAQNIAINLKTAELIGFYLHADILAAADEIFGEIEQPASVR
jgi:ABC-type uncharacterized transport system substrate-binding protein